MVCLVFAYCKEICPLLQKQNNALHESPLEMCKNYKQIHLATGKRTQLLTQSASTEKKDQEVHVGCISCEVNSESPNVEWPPNPELYKTLGVF